MALNDDGNNMVMPVAPMYGGYGNNGGFGGWGGDWAWIIILLLCGWNNGFGGFGGGFGGAGNMMLGYDFPWLLNGQNGINANTNAGFNQAATSAALGDISLGIAGVNQNICQSTGQIQNSLCQGFAGTTAAVTAAQNGIAQQLYTNELASLNRSFDAQTANAQGFNGMQAQLAQCCCDNRLATNDLKYTIATENCADRAAISDGIRDILSATQAQTQAILNQLCSDKIEQKNDTIAQLRQELIFARGQASQDVQTAAIQAGQRALANEVEQYVAPRPIPSYAVQNPNCCAPTGCGCGSF